MRKVASKKTVPHWAYADEVMEVAILECGHDAPATRWLEWQCQRCADKQLRALRRDHDAIVRKLTAAQEQVARLAGQRAELVGRMYDDEGMTMGLIAQTLGLSKARVQSLLARRD